MKHIVLFGAGKSATCLIDFLTSLVTEKKWKLTVADADIKLIRSKLVESEHTFAQAVDVTSAGQRTPLIQSASIVISLLPPTLHRLAASDCLEHGIDLLTASYLSADIRDMQQQIEEKKILFLCEMGLDPGIDHMSAMALIHRIEKEGGIIHSFRSHCGGLVAPESDDNPWKYKISWNPRNVVLAGKQGADFLERGKKVHVDYEDLFDASRLVDVPGLGPLCYYPNRDSMTYIDMYNLRQAHTFVRTTLRYQEFCFGWKHVVDLRLTDEDEMYETDGLSLQEFFKQHFEKYNFSDWITAKLTERFNQSRDLLHKLDELIEAEKKAGPGSPDEIMMVDKAGDIRNYNLDKVKMRASEIVAGQVYEANLMLNQLIFLGMFDEHTMINKGRCSAADILQFALEKKLILKPGDKDMVVMLHEIGYAKNGADFKAQSTLIVKGDDHIRTAMAKTVGLPLGIAAMLRLEGKLDVHGLYLPVIPEIYEPVLKELIKHQIEFNETTVHE